MFMVWPTLVTRMAKGRQATYLQEMFKLQTAFSELFLSRAVDNTARVEILISEAGVRA